MTKSIEGIFGEGEADITIRYGEDATWIQAVDTGAFNSKIFQMELHTQNETGEGFSGEIRALTEQFPVLLPITILMQ